MLQGVELGAAIATAMERKATALSVSKITQAELGLALGMKQSSVSELLKLGRLAKEKLPALLDYFADVVGPDHFGLPFSKFEMDFMKQLRMLPVDAQEAVFKRVELAARKFAEAVAELHEPDQPLIGKRAGATS